MKSIEEACLRDVEMQDLEEALLEDDDGVSDIDFEKLFTLKQLSKKTNKKFTITEKNFSDRETNKMSG